MTRLLGGAGAAIAIAALATAAVLRVDDSSREPRSMSAEKLQVADSTRAVLPPLRADDAAHPPRETTIFEGESMGGLAIGARYTSARALWGLVTGVVDGSQTPYGCAGTSCTWLVPLADQRVSEPDWASRSGPSVSVDVIAPSGPHADLHDADGYRVGLLETDASGWRTRQDVGPGSTESSVEAAYPGLLTAVHGCSPFPPEMAEPVPLDALSLEREYPDQPGTYFVLVEGTVVSVIITRGSLRECDQQDSEKS